MGLSRGGGPSPWRVPYRSCAAFGTAQTQGVGYCSNPAARAPATPTFVELLAPRPGSSPECRVELEGPRGRMRIEFKGIATAELVALSRALWDSESARDQGEA